MHKRILPGRILTAIIIGVLGVVAGVGQHPAAAQEASYTFPETGKTVAGRFLDYWKTYGQVVVLGFPISDEVQEKSEVDSQTYATQYFERAVLERHPANAAPNDVLSVLLGRLRYTRLYPQGAASQTASATNPRLFPETGQTVGGLFRQFWEGHGGLASMGYPISNEFQETNAADGKTYTMQYFERVEIAPSSW